MIPFTKHHGLGNDFILIDARVWGERPVSQIIALCDRHQGVGADGVLLWEPAPPDEPSWDVRMVIINQDGTRPEMCGNGVRCVAALAAELGLCGPDQVRILSDAGVRACRFMSRDARTWQIAVDMGADVALGQGQGTDPGGYTASWVGVSMGNPHAIIWDQPPLPTIDRVGQWLNRRAEPWPQGVNVEFVRPDADGVWDVIVYERGVGRTLACGTGACAVAAALWSTGRVPRGQTTPIRLPGGLLSISLQGQSIWMTGPAARAFEGAVDIDRMIAGRAH